MSDHPTKQTTEPEVVSANPDIVVVLRENPQAGPLGRYIREAADEITILRRVIRAAREELEHGGGGETEAYLILKHSGVS